MHIYKGFSLIELVITLAVVAIMSSLALTFSGAFLQDNRLSTANNDLVGSINLARSVAVSRGQRASICASSNGTSCTGTEWELGWIVFSDNGEAAKIDGNDQIIKVAGKSGVDISISAGANFITFKPQGSTSSTCIDCLNSNQYTADSILVAVFKNLSPISLAHASGPSGPSGPSGSSGSGKPSIHCEAPESKVKGGSGPSGESGESGESHASIGGLNLNPYKDYALDLLAQLSPISSAHASSGPSGPSKSSDTTAKCNDGSTADAVKVALAASAFLICDSSRIEETGNLISVSSVGRVSRAKVTCN